MKKLYFLFIALLITSLSFGQDMVITGVFDGPLSGGIPKAIEIYVINDIADLSTYGIGSANNGGGTDGVEFAFSGSANAGDFLYVATEQSGFNSYFGFDPTFTSGAAEINGDDAIELFGSVVDNSGSLSGTVIDVFGDINVDGSGEAWDYLDGWTYRKDNSGPDSSTFVLSNWTFSGINATDGETSNSTATSVFPIGSYKSGTAAVHRDEIVNFSVFPNPVNEGKIWINTQNNAQKQVKIFDILGKQVLSSNLTGRELNVSKLTSGLYILKVEEEGKTASRKLVIK